MVNRYSIAVIPGDGIGVDVIREGVRVLNTLAEVSGAFRLDYEWFDWSTERYLSRGSYMPDDWQQILEPFQAIYFGAVGWPTVPDHVSLWGLLLPIRKAFDQYANVRPVRLLPGLKGRLRAGEHGGRILGRRRARPSGHPVRGSGAGDHLHAPRHGADHSVRLRSGR
jgi:tartrate dehydrogenase/decarboxylase/D-malate dehydrogenase